MAGELKKESIKFLCDGFVLSVANDLPVKGKMNLLQNTRIYTEGILESRPFLDSYLTLTGEPALVPHSIKAILNKANTTFNRIAGAGTKLFTGNGVALAQKSTGFSGKPLSIVDFRPEQSVESYAYIADENKFVKISVSDTLSDVGITSPPKPVVWKIGAPNRKVVDKIDTGSGAAWNNITGTAGAPTEINRVNTTITKYLADGTLPNFASIVPASFTPDIQKDAIVTLNASEDVIVEQVLPAALNTGVATITKIVYDSGSTGACTIVLSVSSPLIVRDSILLLGGTEYVRVTDVTRDGNNIPSIRTSTVGTFAATNTVSGAASFRFYATVGYAAGNTITGKYIKTAISVAGISSITRTFNTDLLNTGTKPLTLDDIFHISLLISSIANITEIQIQLNISSTGTAFEENYYFFSITPNFFTGLADQTSSALSVLQQAQQRNALLQQQRQIFDVKFSPNLREDYLRDPGDEIPSLGNNLDQTALGDLQWTEVEIPLKEFKRVGTDNSRSLKDVNAIRISVNASAAVDVSIDSLWVGGADGLETISQGFLPYNYVWRLRDPATRTRSNWSPPLRDGIKISRGRIVLTFPDAFANYSHNFKIDIARFGGSLNEFLIVGSIANDNSEYTDTSSDRIIADNDLAGRYAGQGSENAVFDFFKPFAILDTPKKGTCAVTGTTWKWTTGDKLNITYPRGVQIVINGIANKFYTNPSDTETVELERDMGALTGVAFEIEAPLLTGQPLPVIAGPIGQGNFGLFILGIGDKNAAGTLYWLDGNSPDTMSDVNRTEITSPSKPLVGLVIYDGYAQLYSTSRSFTIGPSINSDGRVIFLARENANSRGLFSRWAIDVGPSHIFFLSENADGIYRVQGNGNPECITSAGFNSLFVVNEKAPTAITLIDGTIIYPPDFTAIEDLRIFCTNDFMFFRFKDTHAQYVQLVFDLKLNNFISYDIFPSNIIGATYKEELENDIQILAGIAGGIGRYSSTGTFEALTRTKITPFAFDGGDTRIVKEFNEEVISADQGTDGFSFRNYYDNGNTNDAQIDVLGSVSHKRQQFITKLEGLTIDQGKNAQNITTIFSWPIKSGVKLYEEIFYYSIKGDKIDDRIGDLENAGSIGAKLWQGVVIQADTFGIDKTLKYYDDKNVLRVTLVINHNGEQTISYGFDQPFISHTIRRTSSDDKLWIPIVEAYVTDAEPEAAKIWEGEFNTSELTGLITIKRIAVAYRSTQASIIRLFFDDDTNQVYSLPSSAGKWKKYFFYTTAKKWQSCKWRIDSTEDIRIYKKGCEVWMKSYNSQQGFNPVQPFGGISNISDVMI